MKKEEVGARLDLLSDNIRGAFDSYTNFEMEEYDNAISRRISNLEYTLNGLRVASPSNVYSMLEQLKSDLKGLKDIVKYNRDEEKIETIHNLHQTDIELEQVVQDLEHFELYGINVGEQKDVLHNDEVEKYTSLQIDKFIEENNIKDPNVINEIKAEMRELNIDLGRAHEQISDGMKRTIKGQVEYIGEELVSKSKETLEKEQKNITYSWIRRIDIYSR